MDISKICERIKERRKELDMTQKDLADAMHVSNQLISKWETGESVPSLEYLQQLSEALQTSVSALMGENAVPAPQDPAPAESAPDEKPAPAKPKRKKFNFKAFWKAHFKPLLISIISVSSALLILAITLLSVYVFAPSANKERYIENIDKGIDKYLELGYFNIKRSLEQDGDEDKSPDILQGYLDENGKAVYYNSVAGETVKNGVMTYNSWSDDHYYQKDYVQPDSVKTVVDLFEEQSKTWDDEDDEDDEFGLDDITYIRKSGGGYYLEFSEEYFFKDFKPSEKKNIKLTDKIKGRVEMDGDITQSLEVTLKFRNAVTDEEFTLKVKIELIQEKPEIEHKNYIGTAGAERITKAEFTEKLNAVSKKNALSPEIKEAMKWDKLWYDNDTLYTHDRNSFTVFDQTTYAVDREKSIEGLSISDYASYNNGAIWFVYSDYPLYQLCRFDFTTGHYTEKLTFDHDFSYAGNSHYFFANRDSSGGGVESFVYDMEKQEKIMESTKDKIERVDDAGNIYCYDSEHQSFYIYGTDKKLIGNEIVGKVDDIVYTRYKSDKTKIYQYKSGNLVRVINLSSEYATYGDKYSWDSVSSDIYYLNGLKAASLPQYIALSGADNPDTEYDIRILTIWDNWAICRFEESYSSDNAYIGLVRLGEHPSLVAYTNEFSSEFVRVYRFGDKTCLAIYEDVTSYSELQDFLVIPS